MLALHLNESYPTHLISMQLYWSTLLRWNCCTPDCGYYSSKLVEPLRWSSDVSAGCRPRPCRLCPRSSTSYQGLLTRLDGLPSSCSRNVSFSRVTIARTPWTKTDDYYYDLARYRNCRNRFMLSSHGSMYWWSGLDWVVSSTCKPSLELRFNSLVRGGYTLSWTPMHSS